VFEPKPAGVTDAALAALIAAKQEALRDAPAEVFQAEIVAFDPPRLFELSWGGDRLRFELTDDGGHTRLVFTHTFVDADATNVAAGWHVSLDWLAHRLDGDAAPTTLAQFQALEALYQRALPPR
jgi:hypothetical protein